MRRIHTLVVETDERLSKIKWIRSEKAVRASVLVARKEEGVQRGDSGGASQVEIREAH